MGRGLLCGCRRATGVGWAAKPNVKGSREVPALAQGSMVPTLLRGHPGLRRSASRRVKDGKAWQSELGAGLIAEWLEAPGFRPPGRVTFSLPADRRPTQRESKQRESV